MPPSPSLSTPTRSAAEQAKLEDALRDLYEHKITFNGVVGMKVESFDPDRAVMRFDMRAELVGHYAYGRLHGGVIATVLDVTGSFATMLGMSTKHPGDSADQVMHRFMKLGTIDLRVDYLRPGIGDRFVASANVTRLGSRVGSTQMALHNGAGVLIATACGTYIVS